MYSQIYYEMLIYLLIIYLLGSIMAKMVDIVVKGFKCLRCGHTWVPRTDKDKEPRVCPECKSAWWDVPKKKAKE